MDTPFDPREENGSHRGGAQPHGLVVRVHAPLSPHPPRRHRDPRGRRILLAATGGVSLLLLTAAVIAAVAIFRPFAPAADSPTTTEEAPADTLGPTLVSAAAAGAESIDVVFSENIDPDTVQTTDFAVNTGLAITDAALRPDGRTVRLTSGIQKPGFPYAAGCVAGSVTDEQGNGNVEPNIAKFAGFGATGGTLRVTQAPIKDRPGYSLAKRPGDASPVEAYRLSAEGGDVQVTGITLRGLDSADSLYNDVAEVWLFGDNGDGAMRIDGSDRQLSQNRAFTGSRSGSTVTFGDVQITIPMGTHADIWVVLRLGPMARSGNSVGVSLRDGDIRTAAGTVAPFGRFSSSGGGNTLVVDARGPVMEAAQAVDNSHLDVTFSDVLDPMTVSRNDFRVNAVRPNRASLQQDGRTVRLTVSRPIDVKTVKVAYSSGALQDLAGNPSMAGGSFTILEYTPQVGSQDTTPPTIPGMVTAATGTVAPLVATVSWNASFDSNGVAGYRVWRSSNPATDFASIGATSASPYPDRAGIPGVTYYYRVTALDTYQNESTISAVSNGVLATWTVIPHKQTYGSGNACDLCHVSHQAATSSKLFRYISTSQTSGEAAVCFDCHDGTGSTTDIKNGASDSFGLGSGHSVEESGTGGDLTDACDSCHSPHRDPATRPKLWKDSANGTTLTAGGNQWCFACHNDANSWYRGTYPTASQPATDATGYPVAGTYPGKTNYLNTTQNRHALIPSSTVGQDAGDCLQCHAAHRGTSAYDGLLAEFRPPTAATLSGDQNNGNYAAACFRCHDGTPSWVASGAVNIKQFATSAGTGGHRILTAGGKLPVGAPLPCYDCHNPHGSTRGNKMLIADTLGASLDTSTTVNLRRFCFTCHATSDGRVWNSVTASYTAVTSSMTVEGLRRDGTGGNALKIPAYAGAHESTATGTTCATCHGNDYGAGGSNVHAPSGGASNGNISCYGSAGTGCHSPYRDYMEDGIGAAVGNFNTNYYHHVVGGSSGTSDGDFAAYNGTYPGLNSTVTPDVYCVSCHADHNYFNSNKGANLRSAIGSAGSVTTNTDFYGQAPWGICVSCHAVSLTRDNTDQKPDTSTITPSIDGTGFASSVHSYSVDATISGSPFDARCVKCHDDETATTHQTTSTYRPGFATHYSASIRILSALGLASTPQSTEEGICYRCHSIVGDATGGGTAKGTDGLDWYAAYSMRSTAATIFQLMQLTYGHKVGNYTGIHLPPSRVETMGYISNNKHVECGDCHDVHASGATTHTLGTNAISAVLRGVTGARVTTTATNWTTATLNATATATNEYEICLKCHGQGASGSTAGNTRLASWDASWTNQALEFNTGNQSYHPILGPLPTTDPGANGSSRLTAAQLGNGWTPGKTMYCSDCHGDPSGSPQAQGPHGSTVKFILKGPNRSWPASNGVLWNLGANPASGAFLDGIFCRNCHPLRIAGTNSAASWSGNTTHFEHSGPQVSSTECIRCHILVPHGGKMSRLIGDRDGTMPARYAYQGNVSNNWINALGKTAPGSYTREYCYSTYTACTTHVLSAFSTENW